MFHFSWAFGPYNGVFGEKAGCFYICDDLVVSGAGGDAVRAVIISRNPAVYGTRRLVEALEAAGHEAMVVDQTDCAVVVGAGILHRGAALPPVDVVIPRIGPTATDYGIALVRHFEATGIPSLNSAGAIAATKDRLQSLQILTAAGLPVPKTVLAHKACGAEKAMDAVGGAPVVLKLLRSAKGVGVMLAESAAAARAILETFWALGEELLVQERIEEAERKDTRLVVLTGKVVAAIERRARAGEFRVNIHRGGQATNVDPSPEHQELALRAAAALGLQLGAVDFVESNRGLLVLEVNSTPGLEGLEKATGKDIASLVVAAAETLARCHRNNSAQDFA